MPPSPVMVSGCLDSPGPPTNIITVVFGQAMDTSVLPSSGSFSILSDSVPQVPTVLGWDGTTNLGLSFPGNPPLVGATLTLDVEDINLRCSIGTLANAPQTQAFFP